MAGMIAITGMTRVLSNMRKSKITMGSTFERNLKRAGLFLQRKSMQVVPIDKDILRPSANTRKISGKDWTTDVVVSYHTDYAVYVHEDLNARHKSGKQAKYLEGPARQNKGEIFTIVAKG